MKKKIIGLSILLLVFLLGLSTTTYAKISDDYTYEEFQNIIYNMITNESTRLTDWAESVIENNQETIQTLYSYDRENYFIGRATTNDNGLYIGFYDTNSRTITGNAPNYNINIANNSGQNKLYWYLSPNTNFNTILTDTIRNGNSLSMQALPYFVSTYTFTGQGQTVPAGCNPGRITSGPYQTEVQAQLYFYPEATDQHANVYVFENIPLYTKSNNENLLIGMLTVPNETIITNVLVERFYWNGQNYVPKVLSQDINNNYITYNLYQTDNKQKAYNIYFNKNSLYDNNIYLIEWKDTTKEPYEWTQAVFYIKNNKTTIINGEISPIVTFSGDTNIGDNNIIDNQNDNNDFWKNVYNEMFTLDSGEATQMLDNFITNTNLGEIGTLSGELMALNLLNGEPSDFVISWNNVVIPNLKNNDPKLLIPAGNINFSKLSVTLGNETYTSPKAQDIIDVIGYVRIILGYTIVVLLIANIWETLMHVLGVGTAIYEDNADEKAELYNVDLDTGTVNYTKIHKIPSKKQSWFYHRKG